MDFFKKNEFCFRIFTFKNTGEKILDKFFPLPGNNNLKTNEGTTIKSTTKLDKLLGELVNY